MMSKYTSPKIVNYFMSIDEIAIDELVFLSLILNMCINSCSSIDVIPILLSYSDSACLVE